MITNETELNLYKVTSLENNLETYIIAENFQDLANDLEITANEPIKVEYMWDIYLSEWLINKIKWIK